MKKMTCVGNMLYSFKKDLTNRRHVLMMLMEIGERGLRRKIAEPFKTVPCFLHPLQGALGKVVQEKKDWTLFATAGSRLLG